MKITRAQLTHHTVTMLKFHTDPNYFLSYEKIGNSIVLWKIEADEFSEEQTFKIPSQEKCLFMYSTDEHLVAVTESTVYIWVLNNPR
jgi:hypothetical protein